MGIEAITITTIVLGIDGATWTLLDEWLSDLPTLERIVDDGVSSELESTTPPVTSPAWRCYATGKNPDEIGIYWWRQLNRDTERFLGADQLPLTDECYWERLSDAGYDVAVMGVPLNSPPQEVNGHFIAGGPFADPENYTYPAGLADTLETQFEYQLHPEEYPSIDTATDSQIVRDFDRMIQQRFDVAEWLIEEHNPDVLNLTLFYINVMQHKAWNAPAVKQLWGTIDSRLDDLIEDGDDVIIHSDHGLHKVKRVFYMNAWLEEKGYLEVADPDDSPSFVDMARSATDAIGISDHVSRILPESVREYLTGSGRRLLDAGDYEDRIDFETSQAVAVPQGPVYVLDDEPEFRNQLAAELRTVTDPESNQRIFAEVAAAEEIYDPPLREDAPDLLVHWNDGFEVKNQHSGVEDRIFGPPHGVVADNAPEGILIASGPSLANTGDIETPYLYDLAPTVLHLLDESVPEDMSGSVITGLYDSESEAAQRDVSFVDGDNTAGGATHEAASQDVNDRLQDLGYLE